jgi:prepilin-type N-terminal cleavage/methylation domain-containing protein
MAAPASRARGFTFIEVLVVMGIVGVLAGMLVVVIFVWAKKGPETESRNRVQKVTALVDAWRLRFDGFYPPVRLADLPRIAGGTKVVKRTSNGVNEAIETLWQALNWDGFGVELGITDAQLGNTDEDALDEAITRAGKALLEILDGYGNPLVYFPNTAYAEADRSPPTYRLGVGEGFDGRDVTPRPHRAAHGGFAQPDSFQVFSMGPDGEPNTEDDILGWR